MHAVSTPGSPPHLLLLSRVLAAAVAIVALYVFPLLWIAAAVGLVWVGIVRRRAGQPWGNALIALGLGIAAFFVALSVFTVLALEPGKVTSSPVHQYAVPVTQVK